MTDCARLVACRIVLTTHRRLTLTTHILPLATMATYLIAFFVAVSVSFFLNHD